MTSKTHPIRVDWIAEHLPGMLGLTFAPGKWSVSKSMGGAWQRDLALDLKRLREHWQIDVLVCLLETKEMEQLKVPDLLERAARVGMVTHHLPIPDGGVLPAYAPVTALVDEVLDAVAAGKHVVVHCQGGLGRAGTVGGCALRGLGWTAHASLQRLAARRDAHACPETEAQRAFIRGFDPSFLRHDHSGDTIDEATSRLAVEGPEVQDVLASPRSASPASSSSSSSSSGSGPVTAVLSTAARSPASVASARAASARLASARAAAATEGVPLGEAVQGAILGAAIGDAMGHPTEFLSMGEIERKYGAGGVTTFELFIEQEGRRVAPYTDDTQMAEQVLRSLIAQREEGLDLDGTMQDLAKRFVEWAEHPQGGHRAPGNACLSGCRALASGMPWSKAGGATAGGCGSVMRAYPFGIAFRDDVAKAEQWSVAHSRLTHQDPIALAACAAMAVGMVHVLRGGAPEAVVEEMITAADRYSDVTATMMRRAREEANAGIGPEVTLDRLRAWAAHEAIASLVYIFLRHPDDAERAIVEGANTPGDSDSIATLAGALVGARVGVSALAPTWVRDVERSAELSTLRYQLLGENIPAELVRAGQGADPAVASPVASPRVAGSDLRASMRVASIFKVLAELFARQHDRATLRLWMDLPSGAKAPRYGLVSREVSADPCLSVEGGTLQVEVHRRAVSDSDDVITAEVGSAHTLDVVAGDHRRAAESMERRLGLLARTQLPPPTGAVMCLRGMAELLWIVAGTGSEVWPRAGFVGGMGSTDVAYEWRASRKLSTQLAETFGEGEEHQTGLQRFWVIDTPSPLLFDLQRGRVFADRADEEGADLLALHRREKGAGLLALLVRESRCLEETVVVPPDQWSR